MDTEDWMPCWVCKETWHEGEAVESELLTVAFHREA